MGFKCILNAFIRCVFAKCTKNIFIANYEIVCMLLVKNETKGWKNTVFCQFYEIVCILLVKPYTLEQPKQNYTVVERSTFSSWWAVCSITRAVLVRLQVKIQHCIKCVVFGSSNPDLVNQQRPCFFYFFIVYNSVT